MMVTMPGLPMFAHGQIEGFNEKYGMEYRQAKWDEQPDQYLIQRHEREVFPLLNRRHLFAGVDNFLLYDFFNTRGESMKMSSPIQTAMVLTVHWWPTTTATPMSPDGSEPLLPFQSKVQAMVPVFSFRKPLERG